MRWASGAAGIWLSLRLPREPGLINPTGSRQTPTAVERRMPAEWEQRACIWETGDLTQLSILHFDPYSTTFRLIARGDEPDYFIVIKFIEHGWIELDEMDHKLTDLLP